MKIGRYLIGLLSGLTFGMLFAQKKGKDLRNEILKKGADEPMAGLKALGSAFKSAGAEAAKELKSLTGHEDVAALLEISQEKMKKFLDSAEERGYDVAAFVQEKLEGLAALAKKRAMNIREDAMDAGRPVIRKAVIQKRSYKSAKKVNK